MWVQLPKKVKYVMRLFENMARAAIEAALLRSGNFGMARLLDPFSTPNIILS